MLNAPGFATLEAGNGEQGLELLRAHHPHIVTCDISMPVMDGYEFLEAVRSDPQVAKTPIIVITAMGQEDEEAKATELGADACLTKPFSSSHLLDVVADLVDRQKGQDQSFS